MSSDQWTDGRWGISHEELMLGFSLEPHRFALHWDFADRLAFFYIR